MARPRPKLIPKDLSHDDLLLLESASKTVLFSIAKHLAALATEEGPDEALASGAYLVRMYEEWDDLHSKKIVQQRPPHPRTRFGQRKAG